MSGQTSILLLLLAVVDVGSSAKILFISPSLSNSFAIQSGRLADLLVNDGHDVTLFIPEMVSKNQVNGTKLAKVIRMGGFRDHFMEAFEVYLSDTLLVRISPTYRKLLVADASILFCRDVLRRRAEWEHLRDEQFDVIFTNSLDFCDVGMAHHLRGKAHIWLTTCPLHELNNYVLGIPQPPSYLPTLEENLKSPEMSFLEKVKNVLLWVESTFMHKYYYYKVQSLFNELLDAHFPDLHELSSQSALVFANELDFLSFAGPTLHKVKNIGGAGLQRPRVLEPEFERMMRKGAKGVLLVSFGTNYNTALMKARVRADIVDTIRHFVEYHFIFKIGGNDTLTRSLTADIPNLDLVEWMPQSDILSHPRTRGFVTHGGTNSIIEGVLNGVPLIVVPLFFDQFRNAKTIEHRDAGLFIQENQLDRATLTHSIDQILHNSRYSNGTARMKKLFRESPNQPDQVFLRWTNFVIENGPLPELVPKGVQLGLLQYFCIDVVLFITAVPSLIAYSCYRLISNLVSFKK